MPVSARDEAVWRRKPAPGALDDIIREHALYVTSKLTHYDSINYGLLFEVADQGDPLAKRIVERNLTYWGA